MLGGGPSHKHVVEAVEVFYFAHDPLLLHLFIKTSLGFNCAAIACGARATVADA